MDDIRVRLSESAWGYQCGVDALANADLQSRVLWAFVGHIYARRASMGSIITRGVNATIGAVLAILTRISVRLAKLLLCLLARLMAIIVGEAGPLVGMAAMASLTSISISTLGGIVSRVVIESCASFWLSFEERLYVLMDAFSEGVLSYFLGHGKRISPSINVKQGEQRNHDSGQGNGASTPAPSATETSTKIARRLPLDSEEHLQNPGRCLKCKKCDAAFQTDRERKLHERGCRGQRGTSIGRCSICGYACPHSAAFRAHCARTHPTNPVHEENAQKLRELYRNGEDERELCEAMGIGDIPSRPEAGIRLLSWNCGRYTMEKRLALNAISERLSADIVVVQECGHSSFAGNSLLSVTSHTRERGAGGGVQILRRSGSEVCVGPTPLSTKAGEACAATVSSELYKPFTVVGIYVSPLVVLNADSLPVGLPPGELVLAGDPNVTDRRRSEVFTAWCGDQISAVQLRGHSRPGRDGEGSGTTPDIIASRGSLRLRTYLAGVLGSDRKVIIVDILPEMLNNESPTEVVAPDRSRGKKLSAPDPDQIKRGSAEHKSKGADGSQKRLPKPRSYPKRSTQAISAATLLSGAAANTQLESDPGPSESIRKTRVSWVLPTSSKRSQQTFLEDGDVGNDLRSHPGTQRTKKEIGGKTRKRVCRGGKIRQRPLHSNYSLANWSLFAQSIEEDLARAGPKLSALAGAEFAKKAVQLIETATLRAANRAIPRGGGRIPTGKKTIPRDPVPAELLTEWLNAGKQTNREEASKRIAQHVEDELRNVIEKTDFSSPEPLQRTR
jgi:hypothetical protein